MALAIFVLFCFFLLLLRFVWLQIIRHSNYAAQADENRISIVPTMPARGVITDRNGVVLADNYSAYTLEITPAKIQGKVDEVVGELSELVEISPFEIKRFKRRMEETKRFESVVLKSKLTDAEVARFTVQRYRFPGVEVQARMFRQYPLGEVASHAIGYIGRISQKDMDRLPEEEETNPDELETLSFIREEEEEKRRLMEQEKAEKTGENAENSALSETEQVEE